MKILLAVDGSTCSDAVVEEIATRPWPTSSEIKVLSAFEFPIPPTPEAWAIPPDYFEELDRSAKEHAKAIVERALETLRRRLHSSVAITGECLPGPAKTVILDEAENWNADLIVVGSHGYRAWERFLLGSVSQAIVSHARCSVEVVRTREATTSSS